MSTQNRPLPPKKEVAMALLQGPSLFIHLDPRKPEVSVPPYFKKQPQLVLQVGLNMAIQIPDLKVDDDGVTCTLSFSRSPFWCNLPWSAIYALVGEDGRGMVWPNEVPKEVAAQMDQAGRTARTEQTDPKAPVAAAPPPREKTRPAREPKRRRTSSSDPVVPPAARLRAEKPTPAPIPSLGPTRRELPSTPLGGSPHPSARGASARKGKRELPPYLRVVK